MNKLTKLDVAGLRIGDHVRKIEGPWLQHGFWRRSFRIRDQQTLDELRASGVQYVWIDPERDADSQPADSDDRAQDVTLGDAAPTNPDVVPASGQPESMSAASDAEASAPAEAVDEAMVFEISKGPQPEPPCDAGAAPEPAAQPRIQAVNDSPATSEPLAEQPSARPPKPAPPGRMDPHALPSRQGQSRLHRKDRPSPPSERDWQRAQRICSMAKRVVTRIFDDACNGRQVDTESVMPVVDSVIESVADQPGTLTSLARLKQQDQYTFMHSVAVCGLMTTLGFELGLDDAAVREAATAGLVHDIGKMLVPMDILNKPGRLSAEEFASIKLHTTLGHQLVERLGTLGPVAADVVRHHHERLDGNGYPDGLAGDQISLFARMGTVCDVYDAITSDRPYKKAWEPTIALQQMRKWAPGSYDPVVFQAFVKSIGVFPNGSLVRLSSGRLAVVIDQNPANLAAPMVKVFYSTKSRQPVTRELIELGAAGCRERIEGIEDPARWGLKNLNELWMPVDLSKI